MDAVKRLWRRSLQVVALARGTTAVTDGGAIRTVQLGYTSLATTTDTTPFMQQYGFASRPHLGCDHLTVSMSGDFGRAVVVASNDQRYQFSLVEGEAAIYDDQGQSVHINRAGIRWTDKSGNTLTSTSAGFVLQDKFGNQIVTSSSGILLDSCTGIVTVDNAITGTGEGGTALNFTGTIKTTGDVIANSGASQVSLLNHQQQNGGGTGLSGPPQPGT
jgi:phage gp45-like